MTMKPSKPNHAGASENADVAMQDLLDCLGRIAPLRLAEDWDNVGLLVGDSSSRIRSVMTCLTIDEDVVAEAIRHQADLIVTHHPIPFRPVNRISDDHRTGKLVWQLASHGIAVYSAHTAFDSSADGINQRWALRLECQGISALMGDSSTGDQAQGESGASAGTCEGGGRFGTLATKVSLQDLAIRAATLVHGESVRIVGDPAMEIRVVGFACGSGGSFLEAADRQGCHALVTGEATFHTCLEARAMGIGMVLLGHYWSERFAMEQLADQLAQSHPSLNVWASRAERDPIRSLQL
ncbi:Nif3-like dinuclear metal center hexameric protein [Crateriforma conspicua]|nr:Nif3-like dinuclear metal center hexameric protein [Crateriforma conspicua]